MHIYKKFEGVEHRAQFVYDVWKMCEITKAEYLSRYLINQMPISMLFLFFFYFFSVVAIGKNTKSSENAPSIDDRVDPFTFEDGRTRNPRV